LEAGWVDPPYEVWVPLTPRVPNPRYRLRASLSSFEKG
jgi:hypothetical protein